MTQSEFNFNRSRALVNTDNPTPFVRGSETSEESASVMDRSGRKNQYRNLIYGYLKGCVFKGATCDEVERDLNILHQTASSTIRGLVKTGHIFDSGMKRLTRSNRKAVVWRVRHGI